MSNVSEGVALLEGVTVEKSEVMNPLLADARANRRRESEEPLY
jgi:hypothetical protein